MKLITRAGAIRSGILVGVCLVVSLTFWFLLLDMPGRSHAGPLPPLIEAERQAARTMETDVRMLAGEIGPRAFEDYAVLTSAGEWVAERLRQAGHDVEPHQYEIEGKSYVNYVAELPGSERADEIVIVGAHYDTMFGPGADDNASGVAMMLALAERMRGEQFPRTLRFVAFVNEEPPSFWTEAMGSLVYARELKGKGENVVAMLSLETIGYYSDAPDSQRYPRPFSLLYPSTGDFVGFIGNVNSRSLTKRAVRVFREEARIPSEGAALPGSVPIFGQPVGFQGVDWSDHWSFWKVGYPAIMVTDTAVFRNPYYHDVRDTPDTLDYERMARVLTGLEYVVRDLSTEPD